MKTKIKHIIAFATILTAVSSQGQLLRTGYLMEGLPTRHQLNPAFGSEFSYVSFPLLGNLNIEIQSGFMVSELLFPQSGGKMLTILHPDISIDKLKNINKNNVIGVQNTLSIFSFGGTNKKGTSWNFELNNKASVTSNVPRGLLEFVKKGMDSEQGDTYYLDHMGMSAYDYVEAAFGYSRRINKNIRVGGKAKLLLGAGRAEAVYDQLSVTMTPDMWQIKGNGRAELSFKGAQFENNEDGYIDLFNPVMTGNYGLSGIGFAFDFGAIYKTPLKGLTVTASVFDLGAINWFAHATTNGIGEGDVQFSGFDNIDFDDIENSIQGTVDALLESSKGLYNFRRSGENEDVFRAIEARYNVGVQYDIFASKKQSLTAGLNYVGYFSQASIPAELLLLLDYSPAPWFSLSGSCGLINGKFGSMGVALNFAPKGFNFFIGTDYLPFYYSPQYIPTKSKGFNFQLGISFTFGKRYRGLI